MATSLRIPADLQARIARLAKAKGISKHAFIVQTIAAGTENAERRLAFIKTAPTAKPEGNRTGRVRAENARRRPLKHRE